MYIGTELVTFWRKLEIFFAVLKGLKLIIVYFYFYLHIFTRTTSAHGITAFLKEFFVLIL